MTEEPNQQVVVPDEEQGHDPDAPEPILYNPTLYDEIVFALQGSTLIYGLADLRRVAREGKIDDGDRLEPPIQVLDLLQVLDKNKEVLTKEMTEDTSTLYHSMFLNMLEQLKEKGMTERQIKDAAIVLFDDNNADEECVYSVALFKMPKIIYVTFRGSVTVQDWLADFKALLNEQLNPVDPEPPVPHSKSLAIHLGFREYLDGKLRKGVPSYREVRNPDDPKKENGSQTKCQKLLDEIAALAKVHPDFRIYVAGHSLGGALATLFTFEAANDERLPKPITCISVASPKVGNGTFKHAIQALERKRKLRIVRLVNHGDIVPLLPETTCLFSLMYPQQIFRHVGMKIKFFSLHQNNCKGPQHVEIGFSKLLPRPFGYVYDFLTRMKHVVITTIMCPIVCLCCCASAVEFLKNHGVAEYMKRIKANKNRLEKFRLDDLYEEELKNKGLMEYFKSISL